MFEQACLIDKDNLIKYGTLFGIKINETETKNIDIDIDKKLKSFGIGK
jgi:hypothetical protein